MYLCGIVTLKVFLKNNLIVLFQQILNNWWAYSNDKCENLPPMSIIGEKERNKELCQQTLQKSRTFWNCRAKIDQICKNCSCIDECFVKLLGIFIFKGVISKPVEISFICWHFFKFWVQQKQQGVVWFHIAAFKWRIIIFNHNYFLKKTIFIISGE